MILIVGQVRAWAVLVVLDCTYRLVLDWTAEAAVSIVRRGPGLDPVSYHHQIITGSSSDHKVTPRITSIGQETLVRREGETVGKRE